VTWDQVTSALIGSGPAVALLFGALVYQTKRAERAEAKSESLYQEIMDLLRGLRKDDSHGG